MLSNKAIKIGTHSDMFHCDEALAIFLLKLLPRYKDAVIVRTRDPNVLKSCDILVDVGGEYDHSKQRYDHHMRDFNESLSTVMKNAMYDSTIKLSSAGLIYCHFGHEIIRQYMPKETSNDIIDLIFQNIYYELIQEIDGIDNGIPMFNSKPLYKISTGISSRVGRLNPAWNDKTKNVDEQFQKAIELVGEEFLYNIHNNINVWLPARNIVKKALTERFEIDKSGEIIVLDQNVPWQKHLSDLEKKLSIEPLIKYVIYGDSDYYRLRAVPVEVGSFVVRMFLPKPWGGLRSSALDQVTGISGCEFVHSVRWIGAHKTKEGALEMARKSLEIGKSTCA